MNVSYPFIMRPVGTTLLAIGLMLVGIVAYRLLPVASLPNVEIPTIRVSASRPGADPAIMAATVAAPLERQLGVIAGVTEITSVSSLGSTSIIVQFDLTRSIEGAARDVQAAINASLVDLPSDLPSIPSFRKFNPAAAPVLILALTSKTVAPSAIYDAADTVAAQRIAQVGGVAGQVTLRRAIAGVVIVGWFATGTAHAQVPEEMYRALLKIGQIVDPTCTAKLYRPLMPAHDNNTFWPPNAAAGRAWVREMTQLIHELDGQHPVTLGLHMANLLQDNGLRVTEVFAEAGIDGVETLLIGREVELARLVDAFETVRKQGTLTRVAVVGDAGLGKTRLMSEVERWLELRAEAVWLFRGRAQPNSTNVPYGVLRALFGWRFEILDNDTQAAAHAKLAKGFGASFGDRGEEQVALIGQLIGLDYSASPHVSGIAGDGKQLRDRAFHALTQYFHRLHQQGSAPIVVLLDDLHWADEGSLDFIDHLAQACRDLPMMLLCLARPVLDERRPQWDRGRGNDERIDLGPLSTRSSQDMVESLLRRLEPVPTALRDVVTSNAEGNPYFVEELVAMLIDEGVIVTGPDHWQVVMEKLVDIHIPSTLAGVLQARLDALPPAEKSALQQASVIGHVFWDGPLPRSAPGATRPLDGLLRRDLVRLREPSSFDGVREFAFKHHLLHQVSYDSVLRNDKRLQHHLTAEWLVAKSGERAAEFYGLIADHYERATDSVPAATYWRKAGEVAARTYVTDAALSHFGRALDLTPLGEPGLRYELIKNRVHMLNLTGRRREEESQISELERLAEILNDDAKRAGAASLRARLAVFTGAYRDGASAAARAVALAEQSGATDVALLSRSVWASALRSQGDCAGARVLAEELLGTAREAGNDRRAIDALHLQGSLAARDGRFGVARESYGQALRLARTILDKVFESVQLGNLGEVERALGNYTVAIDLLETGLQLGRDVGASMICAHCLIELAEVAIARGDPAAALALVSEGLAIAREISHGDLEAWLIVLQGDAQSALGRLTDAEDSYHHALRIYREMGRANVRLEPFAGLARAAAALGRIEEGLAHVARVEAGIDAADDPNGAPALLWACHTVLATARSPRANEVLIRAHSVLTERAELLDEADRAAFLGNVPSHRAIMTAWAALSSKAS